MIFGAAVRRNAIRIEGQRSSTLDLARGRLVFVSGFFIVAYALLLMRAFDLTVIQGEIFTRSEDSILRAEEQAVPAAEGDKTKAAQNILRGDIRDRNGVLLATTLKTASLYADSKLIADPEAAAKKLVEIFPGLPYGDTLQKLQGGKRFVWIKRNILPAEQKAVLDIGEPGLEFEYENTRVYPQGELAAHLVGYGNVDGAGLAGVERSFENILSGSKNLDLTMDIRLQHIMRREVMRAVSDFTAKAGVGIMMDVNTGEILAGVSYPDFDPNTAGSAGKDSVFNRLTLGVYELGSVFKIFSTAALLETKGVPLSTKFDAREPLKRGRFTISDYHAEKRILSIPEVFMYSSNIGSAMMGEAVGNEGLKNFYKDLGLLDALDFEIKEVGKPLVPNPWGDISTLTVAFGHGIATTPMQMASAVSSLVNGGYLVRPTLVKHENGGAQERLQVVSQKTSEDMRKLLRLVVTEGTGRSANVDGYLVGGKTGTAEKPGVRGYDKGKLISSFVGAFPMDNPQYLIFIAVDEPVGNKSSYGYATGGWVAAPAVARVIRSAVSVLGLEPFEKPGVDDPSESLKQYVSERKKH